MCSLVLINQEWPVLLHVSCSLLVLLGFSDNPGIAALWHDEKIRREWKGLSEDLVAPPSPGVLYK